MIFSRRRRLRGPEPLPGKLGMACGAAAFVLFVVARRNPDLVESVYGRAIYPVIARALASISGLVPLSLTEWVFAGIVAFLLLAPFAARRLLRDGAGRGRATLGAITALLGRAGIVWCAFVLLWGLNYARPQTADQFSLPIVPDEKRDALIAAIEARLDEERAGVGEDAQGVTAVSLDVRELDRHLLPLQSEALEAEGLPTVPAGRAKPFLASPLLLRWGVSGIYGPFTGEPNIVMPPGPALLPFTIAHERAHLSGFASEDAANFVALLTCWRSPRREVRYSAWLSLWLELRRDPRTRVPGVQRDVTALARFLQTHRGREAPAMRRAYSGYLKAHGVKDGVRSYARVTGLALRWLERSGVPPIPTRPTLEPATDAASPAGG